MTKNHTPTPWRVEHGTTLVWGDCTISDDGAPDRLGVPVADAQRARAWANGHPTSDEADANAAFIVRACNAHDELVKALRLISRHYGNQDMSHVDFRVMAGQVSDEVLAKVEGRS